jgi:serine/threonine protein kinase
MKAIKLEEAAEHLLDINLEKVAHQHSQCGFVVGLQATFCTDGKAWIVQEYCHGGELFLHLSRLKCFTESTAQFYIAEIVLALERMHENDVVFRDLKAENVLLDKDGHAKICDFGLAQINVPGYDEGCSAICGTWEYLAPEVKENKAYGKAVDWYCLGVLLNECLLGDCDVSLNRTPGTMHDHQAEVSSERKETMDKVRSPPTTSPPHHPTSPPPSRHLHFDPLPSLRNPLCSVHSHRLLSLCLLSLHLLSLPPLHLLFPAQLSKDAIACIAELTSADRTTRLGCCGDGAEEVKRHSFFRGLDWDALAGKEITPPIRIDLDNDTDTNHFEDEFTRMPLKSFGNFYSKGAQQERSQEWYNQTLDPAEFAYERCVYWRTYTHSCAALTL